MEKIIIKNLSAEETKGGLLLLLDAEERKAKNGKPYTVLALTDGETKINANCWNTTISMLEPFVKKVVSLMIATRTFNGALSYVAGNISVPAPDEACPIEEFVPKAPISAEEMFQNIIKRLEEVIENGTIGTAADLAINLYNQKKEDILKWSAAKSMHHNHLSGWLEHTYGIFRAADAVSDIYPVNKEMLLAGAALHDIGKLEELDTDDLGTATFTKHGSLFGHTLLGIEIIDGFKGIEAYDSEEVAQLKHIIASHHGKLEYGAISVPATKEAFIIHMLDNMDAKLYAFEESYKDLEPGTVSERGNIMLDGAHVYRPAE